MVVEILNQQVKFSDDFQSNILSSETYSHRIISANAKLDLLDQSGLLDLLECLDFLVLPDYQDVTDNLVMMVKQVEMVNQACQA